MSERLKTGQNIGIGDTEIAQSAKLSVVDNLPHIVLVYDENGELLSFNIEAARIFTGIGKIALSNSSISNLPNVYDIKNLSGDPYNLNEDFIHLQKFDNRGNTIAGTFLLGQNNPVGFEMYTITYTDESEKKSGVAIIADNNKRSQILKYKEEVDSLSGLYTRDTLENYLRENIVSSDNAKKLAIAFIDLNNFKGVNDKLGHLVGNAVIASVGKILNDNVRKSDIAARFGGDEFAISGLFDNENQALAYIERIQKAISEPILIPDNLINEFPEKTKKLFKLYKDKKSLNDKLIDPLINTKEIIGTLSENTLTLIAGSNKEKRDVMIEFLENNQETDYSLFYIKDTDGSEKYFIRIIASIGLATTSNVDTNPSALLSAADKKMYIAKRDGGIHRIDI